MVARSQSSRSAVTFPTNRKGASTPGGGAFHRAALCILLLFVANLVLLISYVEQQDPYSLQEGSPFQMLGLGSKEAGSKSVRRSSVRENLEVEIKIRNVKASDDYAGKLQQMEKIVGARSCRIKDGAYQINGDYCSSNMPVTYYNPLPRERQICGTTIAAKSKLTLDSKCQTPARLFPTTPDITGEGIPPVKTRFQKSSNARYESFPCNVPCLHAGGPSTVTTRFVESIDGGPDWELTFSMEGEAYYGQLRINPTSYKKNHFYSTTSYKSDVPLPYFSWAEYKIQAPPVDFDSAIKGAVFLARNCNSQNNREKIVKELEESIFRVDSLSACLHNAKPPPGVDLANKDDVMKHYLFYLAFENQCVEDYITEKLWGPFQSGIVPVYYGSTNVKEHVPENAVIDVQDFASTTELAKYLQKVAHNKTLYDKHQAWRLQPLPPHFHAKYDFTEIHSTCRTCRWAYARFYGLGWNHNNQSLRELQTPREPCLDTHGHLTRPLVEKWMSFAPTSGEVQVPLSTQNMGSASSTCLSSADATIEVDGGSLRRTVHEQDGAIDLWIERGDDAAKFIPKLLRFEIPFPGSEDEVKVKGVVTGQIRLQSSKTRYTVLTWPRLVCKVKMNDAGGIVEIPVIESSLPLRIRVLVEDVDTLPTHQGADEEENFFARLMIEDFYNPVEAFIGSSSAA